MRPPAVLALLALACASDDKPDRVLALTDPSVAIAVASSGDTVKQMQARDSLHRAAQKRDIDTIATWRLSQQPQWFKSALNRLRAREDSLAQAVVVTDDTLPPPPPPPPPPVASCSSLKTDWAAHPVTAMAKPGYLKSGTDPDFGSTITRITGDPGTPIGGGVSGSWPSSMARHEYAKKQPWSADGKLISLDEMGGAVGPGGQLFLDGTTYQPLFARSHPGPEARWHPTIADVQVYVADNGSVGHWNARTNVSTVKYSTGSYRGSSIGDYEGNLSADGRYVAVQTTRSSDGKAVVYVVDIDAGAKGPDLDVAAQGVSKLDWASVSYGGRYLVLYATISGGSQRVKVFDRATLALVSYWSSDPLGHFDLGLDASGNEAAFGAASGGTYSKRFVSRRLDTGAITALSPATTFNWHSSARNVARPGWGFATTNDAGGPVDREIYALKMDGSNTVERWAHHRSDDTKGYWHAAMAVPSPDGRRVLFASDWGGSTVQTYVVSCQ